ncbi:MAG: TIGR00300 family protein [Dermatophilus congolensis]|nr:TIGR00300 family protein [Dermatophilus congolensis]
MQQADLTLVGHLLSQGLLDKTLATIHAAGASAEITSLVPGKSSQEHSEATLRVTGFTAALQAELETSPTVAGITLGSVPADVALATVEIDGAAPHDFYPTTIFPTHVRVNGTWVLVEKQRMDASIVVEGDNTDHPTAYCCLGRDLRVGQRVVTGHDQGIHLTLPSVGGDSGTFAFMSSTVSSERRVESQVEKLADFMREVKARDGKIVVVAGPVVIHTGGREALARIIRGGWVQSFLAGNAIAAHDIEADIYGTSLGVDLTSGEVVGGGHSHHIRAINRVRRHGGIRASVEQGIVTDGVMKALIDTDVPFVLAGSIRDDGPLTETIMDLIEAQRQYQEQIRGADLILMLSTMLHAIGVGNMTPSGVKMVCVDISPAVATKLADRGSLESIGIVTDVGLFLRLLAEKLGV